MIATRTLFAAMLAVTALSHDFAVAADPDTSCCADLEQRVAELEEATAGKESRSVSLAIFGEVPRALLAWDHGLAWDAAQASDALGEALSAPHRGAEARHAAGFVVELGFTDASSTFIENAQGERSEDTAFEARLANWFVEGKPDERSIRHRQSPVVSRINTIDLSRPQTFTVTWDNLSFGMGAPGEDYAGLIWGDVAWRAQGL